MSDSESDSDISDSGEGMWMKHGPDGDGTIKLRVGHGNKSSKRITGTWVYANVIYPKNDITRNVFFLQGKRIANKWSDGWYLGRITSMVKTGKDAGFYRARYDATRN